MECLVEAMRTLIGKRFLKQTIIFAWATTISLALIFGVSGIAHAQSMEPRAYSVAPVGMNFLGLGYTYTNGDVQFDPAVPLTDASIRTDSVLLGYSRILDIFGRSGSIALLVPYVWLSGDAKNEVNGQYVHRSVQGFADPAVRFSVNILGGPALTLEEFKSYKQDTIVGVSLLISAPLGDYDHNKMVNLSSNRWAFRPEVGFSQALGSWILEAIFGVSFYTTNNDFFGGKKLEQDPIYSFQAHAIYSFKSGIWVSLNGTYYTGGITTLNGVKGDNELSNWRYGITAAFPLNKYNSIKLLGSRPAHTTVGGDYDLIGLVWQVRWGAGL